MQLLSILLILASVLCGADVTDADIIKLKDNPAYAIVLNRQISEQAYKGHPDKFAHILRQALKVGDATRSYYELAGMRVIARGDFIVRAAERYFGEMSDGVITPHLIAAKKEWPVIDIPTTLRAWILSESKAYPPSMLVTFLEDSKRSLEEAKLAQEVKAVESMIAAQKSRKER